MWEYKENSELQRNTHVTKRQHKSNAFSCQGALKSANYALSYRSRSHALSNEGYMELLLIHPRSVAYQNVRVAQRLQNGDFLPQLVKIRSLVDFNLIPSNFHSTVAIDGAVDNLVCTTA